MYEIKTLKFSLLQKLFFSLNIFCNNKSIEITQIKHIIAINIVFKIIILFTSIFKI